MFLITFSASSFVGNPLPPTQFLLPTQPEHMTLGSYGTEFSSDRKQSDYVLINPLIKTAVIQRLG